MLLSLPFATLGEEMARSSHVGTPYYRYHKDPYVPFVMHQGTMDPGVLARIQTAMVREVQDAIYGMESETTFRDRPRRGHITHEAQYHALYSAGETVCAVRPRRNKEGKTRHRKPPVPKPLRALAEHLRRQATPLVRLLKWRKT